MRILRASSVRWRRERLSTKSRPYQAYEHSWGRGSTASTPRAIDQRPALVDAPLHVRKGDAPDVSRETKECAGLRSLPYRRAMSQTQGGRQSRWVRAAESVWPGWYVVETEARVP